MKKNIAVIFGGESTEHDISILTAIQVMNALDKQKYNLLPIYISSDGNWFFGNKLTDIKFYKNFSQKKVQQVAILPCDNHMFVKKFGRYKKACKIDCAILSCHGKNGEDGTLQGLLELAHIPYTSGGVFASSVGLNKQKMKELFIANKIPICDYQVMTKTEFENNQIYVQKIDFPVVVKPNSLGSSIGISVCKDAEQLTDALKLAFCFDNVVLIEKCIQNLKEVNISVLGTVENHICSETEQPVSKGLLSFEKKYLAGRTKKMPSGTKNGMQNADRIIPADITKKQKKTIENLAIKIFKATNSKGVVRIDFLIDEISGKVYANEINTIPGSFAFYLWQKSSITFDKLIDKLIEIALMEHRHKQTLTNKFSSSVLFQNAKIAK